ncbi:MAG: M28 family peptidase, partial [Gemmatimonadales bacterium]
TVEGDSLRLRNLIARFRPEDPNRILFLAHWDTRPLADASLNIGQQMLPVPGANDGASGVAILLGIADALRANPPTVGVDLLFVDGEDYGDFSEEAGAGADVLIGSRHFAANLPPDYEPLFGVLFDLVGDSDLQIYQEGYSINGAPEVVARVWRAAADAGYRRIFVSSVRHTILDDHVPLLEAGLRVVNVIDFDYPFWHTTEDTVDKVSWESLQIVGDVAMLLIRQ